MEIRLPTAEQSESILKSIRLPSTELKLISRNTDKSLIWYDTERRIVYATDRTIPNIERTKLFASHDYGLIWKHVYTAPSGITSMRTLKSGFHLIRDSGWGKIRRVPPNFVGGTYHDIPNELIYQPLNSDNGIAQNDDGVIVWAGYSVTGETKLYRSIDDGISWQISRVGNDIRHWHSVQVDPYTGHFWACSGDNGTENKILVSLDNAQTWVVKTEGTQADRAVGLVFTRDSVYWGMDSTSSPKVYKASKDNFQKTFVVDVPGGNSVLGIAKAIDGSIIFWTRTEETNLTQKDHANFFILKNDEIKSIHDFVVNPNRYGGFTVGSSVDDNNIWFVDANATVMNGIMCFSLPISV